MFNSSNGYSLADIAAATGMNRNNDGYGDGMFGNGAWWIIILFLFCFNGGGWGNWGGRNGVGDSPAFQGTVTRADLCSEFNFNNLDSAVRAISDNVNLGFSNLNSTICHQQYDTAMLIGGVNDNITSGFHGVDNAICQLGYQTQNGFNQTQVAMMQNQNALQTQLADCCCQNRTGQMQIGNQIERAACDASYNAATNTTAIIQNAHNDTDRILARLEAMESARKDETIADLRSKLAACGDQNTAQYIINELTGIISPRAVPCYPGVSSCGLGNWSSQVLANGCNSWNNGCGGCCN